MLALVALVVLGSIKALGGSSSTKLTTVGAGIHSSDGATTGGASGSPSAPSDPPPAGGEPPLTTPPPTTVPPAPSTTSTAPATTTTATPTTTTTAAPTTTMAPTTTTAPPVGGAEFAATTSARSGSSNWTAGATLVLADRSGGPMPGAVVSVRARAYKANGSYTDETITVTVGSDGTAQIGSGPYRRTGSSRVTSVTYTVTAVDPPAGATWDRVPTATTIAAAA